MTCPKCGGRMRGKDTRCTPENETIRKRKCDDCGEIMFTLEFEVEPTKQLIADYMEVKKLYNREYRRKQRDLSEVRR